MAISMKDLQSVHLKKTENAGTGGSRAGKSEVTEDPIRQLLKKSQKGSSIDVTSKHTQRDFPINYPNLFCLHEIS